PAGSLFRYTTLFRSDRDAVHERDDIAALGLARRCPLDRELCGDVEEVVLRPLPIDVAERVALRVAVDGLRDGRAEDERVVDVLVRAADRKSTRLNSSHVKISYAVFCLKKKKTNVTKDDQTACRYGAD